MEPRAWHDRIAHDLRGPLTSLQTAAWLLKSDPAGANTPELADIIVRQAQRLARMIEELDDFSRVDQQRLVDQRVHARLAELLDMALSAVPGCMAEPEYADGTARDATVEGDETRLAQLFRILAEHALARDPGFRLRVTRRRGDVELLFADAGPALDAEQRAQLFAKPRIDDGLGLRLLIADAIARAHGGRLEADAADGGLHVRCVLPTT